MMDLGTGTRDEFQYLELAKAARQVVTEILAVRPGENVLINADTRSDVRVVNAIAQAVFSIDGIPTVIWHPTNPNPCMDPPTPVRNALLQADWWIDLATSYLLYSPAYDAALETGCRYFGIPGMDVDMMVRTIGQVNYQPLEKMKFRLNELSQAAECIRATSPAGTNLSMKVDPSDDPFFGPPPQKGGYAIMLGGQSGFLTYHDSFEGTLVFDGCISPPMDLGILNYPVTLHIEKGNIVSIEGKHEARTFQKWLESFNDPLMFMMDHACYGFNPGVTRPTGRILEDERVFGCMQFGIGPAWTMDAPSHTDGVVLNASVWADSCQLEDEGVYIHPDLVVLCKEMGVPGY
jgi:leucyl aminopeptidase (aminopeptidase T)